MQHVKRWKTNLLVCCFIVGIAVSACQKTPAVLPPSSPPAPETPLPAHIAEQSPLPLPTQTPAVIFISPLAWPETVPIPHPGAVICESSDSFFKCEDLFLGIYFEYPKEWGALSVALVRDNLYNYSYTYQFAQSYTQAGGRGHYISEFGRGRMPTDFNGYSTNFATNTCLAYGAATCEEIQPGVLYMEDRPDATSICRRFETYSVANASAGAFVAINLPEHEQITGFIFMASILPEPVTSDLLSLLDSDGTMSGCRDADKVTRFDTEVEALYTSLHNQTAVPAVMAEYQQMLHLVHSIRLQLD